MPADAPQAEILFAEGNRLLEEGSLVAAEACFRQALLLAPGFAEAMANLGLLLERMGSLAEAEGAYRAALAVLPGHAQLLLNLGGLLTKMKHFAEAEAVYRDTLALHPQWPAAWSNLGVLLACTKRETEAEAAYRTALALDPGYAMARFNLSYVLLRQGRFEEGWPCLEARAWYAHLERHFTCPRWRGEPLAGKSLVIGFELGHGDMIQFCRYAALLKDRGAARITLVCHPGLKSLLATLRGVDEVLSFEDAVPADGWDFWSPPLSLPVYCQTRLATIPAMVPYLSALPAAVADWSLRLPAGGKRVGLVWKGNPRFENDADRSLPSLEWLAPLCAINGLRFVSLQKGAGEDEAAGWSDAGRLLAVGGLLADFSDTAAVIANLDLIISVDTAVAHLAGALGKPCWVLLPDYRTDWRWLTDRPDSPWYPGMRLFRQAPGGGWSDAIRNVAEALAAWSAT